jgi:predicted RNase H-like HicB family nuclease
MDPNKEFSCPHCHAPLTGRQVVTKTWESSSCPRCHTEIERRVGFTWEESVAIIQEDVAAIDHWLDEVSKREGVQVEAARPKADRQPYEWDIQGAASADKVLVAYDPARYGILEVRLLSFAQILDPTEDSSDLGTLMLICAAHGVQPVGVFAKIQEGPDGRESSESVRWGARCYLNTDSLLPELFRPVLNRLDEAVRHATAELKKARAVRPMKLKVVLHEAEEGGFWAEIPALPGCFSEGETKEDVLANIREAAQGWLEVASEREPAETPTEVQELEL